MSSNRIRPTLQQFSQALQAEEVNFDINDLLIMVDYLIKKHEKGAWNELIRESKQQDEKSQAVLSRKKLSDALINFKKELELYKEEVGSARIITIDSDHVLKIEKVRENPDSDQIRVIKVDIALDLNKIIEWSNDQAERLKFSREERVREKVEREAKEKEEREKAEKEAKEISERERQAREKEQAEREEKERAERAKKEEAERIAREKAEAEAKERKEQAEAKAREQAEVEAKEKRNITVDQLLVDSGIKKKELSATELQQLASQIKDDIYSLIEKFTGKDIPKFVSIFQQTVESKDDIEESDDVEIDAHLAKKAQKELMGLKGDLTSKLISALQLVRQVINEDDPAQATFWKAVIDKIYQDLETKFSEANPKGVKILRTQLEKLVAGTLPTRTMRQDAPEVSEIIGNIHKQLRIRNGESEVTYQKKLHARSEVIAAKDSDVYNYHEFLQVFLNYINEKIEQNVIISSEAGTLFKFKEKIAAKEDPNQLKENVARNANAIFAEERLKLKEKFPRKFPGKFQDIEELAKNVKTPAAMRDAVQQFARDNTKTQHLIYLVAYISNGRTKLFEAGCNAIDALLQEKAEKEVRRKQASESVANPKGAVDLKHQAASVIVSQGAGVFAPGSVQLPSSKSSGTSIEPSLELMQLAQAMPKIYQESQGVLGKVKRAGAAFAGLFNKAEYVSYDPVIAKLVKELKDCKKDGKSTQFQNQVHLLCEYFYNQLVKHNREEGKKKSKEPGYVKLDLVAKLNKDKATAEGAESKKLEDLDSHYTRMLAVLLQDLYLAHGDKMKPEDAKKIKDVFSLIVQSKDGQRLEGAVKDPGYFVEVRKQLGKGAAV